MESWWRQIFWANHSGLSRTKIVNLRKMTLSIHPLTQKIQLIHPFFLCFSSCCEILPNPKTPVALLKGLSGRTQASSKHLFSGDESSPRCLLEGNKSRIWKNIWKKTGISLKMGGLGPICSPWVSWVLALHNGPKCLPDWSASDCQCTPKPRPEKKVFSPRKKRSELGSFGSNGYNLVI